MRRAAAWLKEQGAIVLDAIEDPDQGHGALLLNANNARRVLNRLLLWSDAKALHHGLWER
jgi:hypothetical protein